jgi:hypothetical protein
VVQSYHLAASSGGLFTVAANEFPIDLSARHVGWLVLEWAHFECALEMISYRIPNINERQSSILFASSNYLAKKNICTALLFEEPREKNKAIIKLIQDIKATAKRNHIIHSVLAQDPRADRITFLKRSISKGLSTERKDFTSKQLEEMIDWLQKKVTDLFALAEITEPEQIGYLDITHSRD